jgi:hypothetical protein
MKKIIYENIFKFLSVCVPFSIFFWGMYLERDRDLIDYIENKVSFKLSLKSHCKFVTHKEIITYEICGTFYDNTTKLPIDSLNNRRIFLQKDDKHIIDIEKMTDLASTDTCIYYDNNLGLKIYKDYIFLNLYVAPRTGGLI